MAYVNANQALYLVYLSGLVDEENRYSTKIPDVPDDNALKFVVAVSKNNFVMENFTRFKIGNCTFLQETKPLAGKRKRTKRKSSSLKMTFITWNPF